MSCGDKLKKEKGKNQEKDAFFRRAATCGRGMNDGQRKTKELLAQDHIPSEKNMHAANLVLMIKLIRYTLK